MSRTYLAIGMLSALLALGTAVQRGEATAQRNCDRIIRLLPEALHDLPKHACLRRENGQVTLVAQLVVPAARVLEVQRILITSHNMEPLRFVCCGYETRPITLPVPEEHPLAAGTPEGAIRSVILTLGATAIGEVGATPEPLGQSDADLTLELVDY